MHPSIQRAYRGTIRRVGEAVTVSRLSGQAPSLTTTSADVYAVIAGYTPEELAAGVIQGSRRVIVLSDDLSRQGFPIPVTVNDKVKITAEGRECNVMAVDLNSRRMAGAYELTITG